MRGSKQPHQGFFLDLMKAGVRTPEAGNAGFD